MTTPSPRKTSPWRRIAPRLFKRDNTFYLRARVPRDLQATYRAGRPLSEICESLRTTDRREAERRCRQRGAEIDAEFEQRRGAMQAAEIDASAASRQIDRIAQGLYRHKVQSYRDLYHDDLMRDPSKSRRGSVSRQTTGSKP